jgi:rhodanese-related sulfurtransferase
MKHYFAILILLLVFSDDSTCQVPDSLKYISLPPAEFLAAYNMSEKKLMIDVREFFEYKKSRLKDAINIPSMGSLDLPVDTIDKNNELFFYCTSGFRSKRMAKAFYDKGFTKCYSLEGGIVAYRKAKLPVEKKRLRTHD